MLLNSYCQVISTTKASESSNQPDYLPITLTPPPKQLEQSGSEQAQNKFLSKIRGGLSNYKTLLDSLPLSTLDMRNYVSALTESVLDSTESAQIKSQISTIWEEAFAVENQDRQQTLDISALTDGAPGQLRIAVVGAGVAGCGLFALAAQSGHSVTVFDKRQDPPSRENLVTVNHQARPILETLVGSNATIFQTNGDIGCSERVALKDIENALINSAENPQSMKRGYNDFQIAHSSGSPMYTRLIASSALEGENSKPDILLDDLDIVFVCPGARLANPYERQNNFVTEHFSLHPVSERESAMAFMKFRFPVTERKPCLKQREIEVVFNNKGQASDKLKFINIYTGRRSHDGSSGQDYYETSLLMDCPSSFCDGSLQAKEALDLSLSNLAEQLQQHSSLEVQQLGRAILGLEPSAEKVQQGVADVSLWYPERAVSEKAHVVGIGDAMAPPNPWTGSGSNIALRSLIPVNTLLQKLSKLKALGLDSKSAQQRKKQLLMDFNNSVVPLHREAVLRGLLASRIFGRANSAARLPSIDLAA